jgi:phosphate transport system permease protein
LHLQSEASRSSAAFPVLRAGGEERRPWERVIQVFFGGNALFAVLVLGLIVVFLFREGSAFFGQNRASLALYRAAGLELVDRMRVPETRHTALTRQFFELRLQTSTALAARGWGAEKISRELEALDAFAVEFEEAVAPLSRLVTELGERVSAVKLRVNLNEDRKEQREQLLAAGRTAEAAAVAVEAIDPAVERAPLLDARDTYEEITRALAAEFTRLAGHVPASPAGVDAAGHERFRRAVVRHAAEYAEAAASVHAWDAEEPVPMVRSFAAFLFGREWLTASFWQDWYGMLPLLVGSLMVSAVALSLAVPLGIGAAVYLSQFASPGEQRVVKPCIEFISAFPSVVLGFFGIAVLGEALRAVSALPWLSWVPGFPMAERLTALTAGCLLALMAIPTIFTLAEDALQNVPRGVREASLALGATRLQTTMRVMMPAALSGIVSACLLGFGRVIGETMVVLLCAGNRIAVPDFTEGLGVFAQPVHTMTGLIAQEMGEVVRGGIHYRALFVVGMVLFGVSLAINYIARRVFLRHRPIAA